MDIPALVVFVAIGPGTAADQETLDRGLRKLMAEGPTFRVETDPRTGRTIIRGTDDQHLDGIVNRLQREFNVVATIGEPQVAYKETLTRPAEGG